MHKPLHVWQTSPTGCRHTTLNSIWTERPFLPGKVSPWLLIQYRQLNGPAPQMLRNSGVTSNCFRLKSLVLVYHAAKGSGSSYIQNMVKPYTPVRPPSSDCQMACYSPSWGAAAKHNLDCLVSWLHNGWTSCPLTSGQLRHYPTDQSVSCPIKLKNLYLLLLYFSSESCLLIW